MSAEHTELPPTNHYGSLEPADEISTDYATWWAVTPPTDDQPYPVLVLGTSESELHLELAPDLQDHLLVTLAEQVDEYTEGIHGTEHQHVREPLARRVSAKAVSASGWRTADRWWRSSGAGTQIVVVGAIAAVMILGLLVTF
ncbi:hypothetical protein [Streptomyces niveus]|uniref:hypothetical protein n=1 Tax=Streptomyces niveus TaxID=193462 RepID=UPI003415CF03